MALVDDYENAVRSGDTKLANYLAQALASQNGININTNDVSAASPSQLNSGNGLPSLPTLPSLSQAADALFQGILHPLDTLTGKNTGTMNDQIAAGHGPVTSTVGAATSAVSFITDIPRVVTAILGLIMIIAGIFALSKGPAVNIVSSAVKTAAIS